MRDLRNPLILVLGAATAFLAGTVFGRPGESLAQQSPGATPGNYGGGGSAWNQRYIAVTGAVGSGMSVLWLVDTEKRRLLVYGTNSLGKTVELRAGRWIEWDSSVEDYHDESQYLPEDLQRRIEKRRPEPVPPPKPKGDDSGGGAVPGSGGGGAGSGGSTPERK
ncbi:MAG: hypothetical protein HMLKMBBP_02998 [Planctomycetes bacterium]|nr:hypothetical protein [Planctomycetota bacterium]